MIRDPLYLQIRRGLRDLKVGDEFELCANDVLRKFHPSLVPEREEMTLGWTEKRSTLLEVQFN